MTMQLKTNIIGNRYGKLVVKEIVSPKDQKSRCNVQCDCGNQKEVFISNLKQGLTTTCGCSHHDIAINNCDIEGNRYGRLVVESRSKSEKNRARWFCKCDCGRTCTATGKTLREGKKKSCGCIKREQLMLPPSHTSRNALMCLYSSGAHRRGYEFNLSMEQFIALTSGNCYYCGMIPSSFSKIGKDPAGFIYNGIDRVDNTLGYSIENCVPCCTMCNRMKMSWTQSDFLNKCIAIANNCKKSAEMSDSCENK